MKIVNLLLAFMFTLSSSCVMANDDWNLEQSSCEELNASNADRGVVSKLTASFLNQTQVLPVTPQLVKHLKDLSNTDFSTFKQQLQDVCESIQGIKQSPSETGLKLLKLIAGQATGPFGKYVIEELKTAEAIVRIIRTYQGADFLAYGSTGDRGACSMNLRPYIKLNTGWWKSDELLDEKSTTNKIIEISAWLSFAESYTKIIYLNTSGNVYSSDLSDPLCLNNQGASLNYIELLMDNSQRLYVPVVSGTTVDVSGEPQNVYFDLIYKDGKYSIKER